MVEDGSNICRVFTFYSNFLPARKEAHNWKYCAFGTIDGIDVGSNIAKSDAEVLDCIWQEQTRFQKELSGTYNAERIYGVRCGDKEEEEEFWREDPEYPFLFFIRIQCEGDKNSLLERNNRSNLEHELSLDGKVKVISYLTYGNSDLFLVLKTRIYHDGTQIIHLMNQGMNLIFDSESVCFLKNSFSIMAVRHTWIDEMEPFQRKSLNEIRIERVCIRIIKAPNGDVAVLKSELEKRFPDATVERYSLLGVDDEMIVITRIGWSDFLSLYSMDDSTGMFCNSNKNYREHWAGLTTVIEEKALETEMSISDEKFSFIHDLSAAMKDSLTRISDHSEALENWYNSRKEALMEKLEKMPQQKNLKEINIILNSVPRYAGGLFNDYIFFSILPPLDFLLCLMQKNMDMGVLYMPDYYDFLKAFCMYVQGSLTSDRHSIQAIDFNSKLYEVPAKLIAFYSAHIAFVKKILSAVDVDGGEDPCEYEFLVAPGINNIVQVDELYCRASNNKRLMKVEIPEFCLYNLHDMMIILTHETAHYVGRTFRLREEVRYDSLLRSFSHVYVSYVRGWCLQKGVCQGVGDDAWKQVERRMKTMLHRALMRKLDKEYVCKVENEEGSGAYNFKRAMEKNKKYGKHMSQLRENIQMAMIDIVQYALENVFGPVLYEQDNVEEIFSYIKQASERYVVVHESDSTLMTSKTTMELLSMIYEEGFADLMAVLVLDMNAIEYVNSIINDVKRQNREIHRYYKTELLHRIAIVLECCIYNKIPGWDLTDRGSYRMEKEKHWTEAEMVAGIALTRCDRNRYQPVSPKRYHMDLENILCDDYVVREVRFYLMRCADKFHVYYDEVSDDMKTVRTMFKEFSSTQTKSAEEQIKQLIIMIEKSREEMLREDRKKMGECHER